MASLLVVAPEAEEAEALLAEFERAGVHAQETRTGRITCAWLPALDMFVGVGGNGKAQFGVQAQHLIDHSPRAEVLVCVGAAGSLAEPVRVGDLVVATASVEHDVKERFSPRPLPRHEVDPRVLDELVRAARASEFPFAVHFGPVASGDEDVVDASGAERVRSATQALCVAWEGAGGARAARFSGLAFVEVRAISDRADAHAAASFRENLREVVPHAARLLLAWRAAPGAASSLGTRPPVE
jgi:adenosylhomocysteine nucleosidase